MPVGILNPQDSARSVSVRPAHSNNNVDEQRWWSRSALTRLYAEDMNAIKAQFLSVFNYFEIPDVEGDDTLLTQAILAGAAGAVTGNLARLQSLTPAANRVPYFSSTTSMDVFTMSGFSRTLAANSTASAWKAALSIPDVVLDQPTADERYTRRPATAINNRPVLFDGPDGLLKPHSAVLGNAAERTVGVASADQLLDRAAGDGRYLSLSGGTVTGTLGVANATAGGHAMNRNTSDGRYLQRSTNETITGQWAFTSDVQVIRNTNPAIRVTNLGALGTTAIGFFRGHRPGVATPFSSLQFVNNFHNPDEALAYIDTYGIDYGRLVFGTVQNGTATDRLTIFETGASVFNGVVSVENATAGGHALNRNTADARYPQKAATEAITGSWTFPNAVSVGNATANDHAVNRATGDGRYTQKAATETISGTWTFSSALSVGNATVGGHALNRTTGDGRYPQKAATETISGSWTFSGVLSVGNATAAGHALNRITADDRYPLRVGAQTVTGVWTFTNSPILTRPGANNSISLSGGSSNIKDFRFQTEESNRWVLRSNAGNEGPDNAGSNFEFLAYANDGSVIGAVFTVNRASRVLTFPIIPTTAGGDPTTGNQLTRKVYVDDTSAAAAASAISSMLAANNTFGGTQKFNIVEVGTFSSDGASSGQIFTGAGGARHRRDSSTSGTSSANHNSFFNANGNVGGIATINMQTNFNTSSDGNLKDKIVDADHSAFIAILKSARPVEFEFKKERGVKHIGFIAQEMAEVFPDAVTPPTQEGEPWMMDHSKLVPVLWTIGQTHEDRIEDLETTIQSQKNQIELLIDRVTELESA